MDKINKLIEELYKTCQKEEATLLLHCISDTGAAVRIINGGGGRLAQGYADLFIELNKESDLSHDELMRLAIQESIDNIVHEEPKKIEKCPRCGSEIKDPEHNYCTICGLPLKGEK